MLHLQVRLLFSRLISDTWISIFGTAMCSLFPEGEKSTQPPSSPSSRASKGLFVFSNYFPAIYVVWWGFFFLFHQL